MNDSIEVYRTLVRRLGGLLDDPQPGLLSWGVEFDATMKRLISLWNGDGTVEEVDVDIDEVCHSIATSRGTADLAASPSYTLSAVPSDPVC